MIAAEDVCQRIHAAGLRLHRYSQTFDENQLRFASENLKDALAMVEVMLAEEPKRLREKWP